ncbi:hypothetical protein NCC78_25200 [Micromonospora phytophila]|uniref:hypothetical protein n=1 Tax=Micromonospora phytophila TaxID=709888 RepID=UPI00202F0228|nr:hypothetical protein [Micromonospora phytophila]MCM0677948.1 hypothetical protein [Micromonospora phytophila]
MTDGRASARRDAAVLDALLRPPRPVRWLPMPMPISTDLGGTPVAPNTTRTRPGAGGRKPVTRRPLTAPPAPAWP